MNIVKNYNTFAVSTHIKYLISLFSFFFLASCTGQGSVLPESSDEEIAEVQGVLLDKYFHAYASKAGIVGNAAYRINQAALPFCSGREGAVLGFQIMTLADVPKHERSFLKRGDLLSSHPTVIAVAKTSKEYDAGLKVGDRIIAVFEQKRPKNKSAHKWLKSHTSKLKPGQKLDLTVVRAREQQEINYVPAVGCNYPVHFAVSRNLNAYATSDSVVIYAGLVDLLANEPNVAVVVGHELAHVVKKHSRKKTTNKVAGMFGGAIVDIGLGAAGINTGGAFAKSGGRLGALAYSQNFEREADYVGLYLTARAGYDTSTASDVWHRIALQQRGSILFSSTHPTAAERALLLEKTHREIEEKRQNDAPILPDTLKQRQGQHGENSITRFER